MTDLVSIGECMVELSRQPDGRFSLAYGGDTFNTAAYAARLGLDVAYGTALGEDPYSAPSSTSRPPRASRWTPCPGCRAQVPGLYVIETDEQGRTQLLLLARRRAGPPPLRAARKRAASPAS